MDSLYYTLPQSQLQTISTNKMLSLGAAVAASGCVYKHTERVCVCFALKGTLMTPSKKAYVFPNHC